MSDAPRVLFMTLDFPPNRPGGMANYHYGIATHYPENRIVVLTAAARTPIKRKPACKVYRVALERRFGKILPMVLLWTVLAVRIVVKEKITVMHCGNASPFRYVAYLVKCLTGVPYVIYFHGNDLMSLAHRIRKSSFKRWSLRKTCDAAAGFVAISEYTRQLAIDCLGIDEKLIILCLPGVDDAFLGVDAKPPDLQKRETVTLTTVGRLTQRKGQDRVIQSLTILTQRGYNVRYKIVGGGDENYLRRVAGDAGVSDKVELCGFARDNHDLITKLGQADIFVMVSRILREGKDVEGFGIVYLEAAAVRRPAIGGRAGGVADALVDKQTGLLVDDPDSPEQIADAIAYLIEHPDEARKLGNNGYDRVNRDFAMMNICRKLEEDVTGLLKNGSSVSPPAGGGRPTT